VTYLLDTYGLYAGIFAALLAVSRLSRNEGAWLSACVLVAVWIIWSGSIEVFESNPPVLFDAYEPWPVGIFLDAVAAWFLLLPGDNMRGRAIIASLFALQIAAHVAYGWQYVATNSPPWWIYEQAIEVVFLAQIAAVGAWASADILRNWGSVSIFTGRPYNFGSIFKRGVGKK